VKVHFNVKIPGRLPFQGLSRLRRTAARAMKALGPDLIGRHSMQPGAGSRRLTGAALVPGSYIDLWGGGGLLFLIRRPSTLCFVHGTWSGRMPAGFFSYRVRFAFVWGVVLASVFDGLLFAASGLVRGYFTVAGFAAATPARSALSGATLRRFLVLVVSPWLILEIAFVLCLVRVRVRGSGLRLFHGRLTVGGSTQ